MSDNYFEIFEKALRVGLDEVNNSLSYIKPEAIQQALEYILPCNGKLILTGVGKSGLIAKKMAATFSSTGTPAFFLHPGDALHGDLGAMRSNDVMLVIAKSGESDEIVGMLRVVQEMKIPVISILGNPNSSMGRMSSVIIHAPVSREADPLDLAPTASTTLALVIGDALAITLARLRNFKPEHFAMYHPAGQLGRRLILKVNDFLTDYRSLPVARIDISMTELLQIDNAANLGATMIINSEGELVGIITDGDLRRGIVQYGNVLECTIEQIMTPDPVTIQSDTLAIDALRLMENRSSQISVLPVIDEKRHPIGLLRLHDLMQAGL